MDLLGKGRGLLRDRKGRVEFRVAGDDLCNALGVMKDGKGGQGGGGAVESSRGVRAGGVFESSRGVRVRKEEY